MKPSIIFTSLTLVLLFILFMNVSSSLFAQDTFQNCSMEGTATNTTHKKANRKKNRYNLPSASQFDSSISLESMIHPGNDINRFVDSKAVIITGWVNKLTWGSEETCNCGHTGQDSQDVHIEIVPTKNTTSKKKIIVAEITPRLRKKIFEQLNVLLNPTLANGLLENKLKKRKVKIQGWLFFDEQHKKESFNIDPDNDQGKVNRRATVWEIHPITKIEIID